jgi:hypothetical protein
MKLMRRDERFILVMGGHNDLGHALERVTPKNSEPDRTDRAPISCGREGSSPRPPRRRSGEPRRTVNESPTRRDPGS